MKVTKRTLAAHGTRVDYGVDHRDPALFRPVLEQRRLIALRFQQIGAGGYGADEFELVGVIRQFQTEAVQLFGVGHGHRHRDFLANQHLLAGQVERHLRIGVHARTLRSDRQLAACRHHRRATERRCSRYEVGEVHRAVVVDVGLRIVVGVALLAVEGCREGNKVFEVNLHVTALRRQHDEVDRIAVGVHEAHTDRDVLDRDQLTHRHVVVVVRVDAIDQRAGAIRHIVVRELRRTRLGVLESPRGRRPRCLSAPCSR